VDDFAKELLTRFRWIGGHADVLGLLTEDRFLERAAEALTEPFRSAHVRTVAGIEARGFIFGAGAALRLGAGFLPIRKEGSIHPGPKASLTTGLDWRGREVVLHVQRHAVGSGDRVLLVDDWAETGSQALAARALLEDCGAEWVGLSLLVDQLGEDVRRRLEPVASVVRYEELPSE
jgi:adenine phosphoribosyltransferase